METSTFLQDATKDKTLIISDRRYLHTHPGTGFEITDTKEYVAQKLQEMGIEPVPCGKAGLIGLIGGKIPGRVFLLRADMDGLPIREEADVDFASSNGNMHACGHDFHTAMLLEAARLLKQRENQIPGTVKLMFQPAEEILQGSADMMENGVLENPTVDAGLMIHLLVNMPFKTGTAIVTSGGVSAPAADYFTITVHGKGCHGAMPDMGIDPITAAAHIILGLQEILARELSLSDNAVLTIGSIHAGNAGNAIPDTAILSGTLRAYDDSTRNYLKTSMSRIVEHIAAAFQANAAVTFGNGCPTLLNDPDMSECTLRYIRELTGPENAFSTEELARLSSDKTSRNTGSEDFSYISHAIPTIMIALAAGEPQKGYNMPLHHPRVQFDEEALPIGAAIYAHTAIRWLEEHP